MKPVIILSFFTLLLVVLSVPGFVQSVQGEEGISAEVAREEIDNEVIVSVRIVSSWSEGDISVLVKDEGGEVVLLETVALSDGFAVVQFKVDPEEAEGDYTVFVTGVTQGGEVIAADSNSFMIEPLPSSVEYEDWMIIVAVLGFSVIIGMAIRRSKGRKGPTQVQLTPVVQTRIGNGVKESQPNDFKRPLTGNRETPVTPQQAYKQEIHHHYAPQYDQSHKTENIIDSVLLKKRP